MYRIMYYINYEGWDFYSGKIPPTKAECVALAKQLHKANNLDYKVVEILFEVGKKGY